MSEKQDENRKSASSRIDEVVGEEPTAHSNHGVVATVKGMVTVDRDNQQLHLTGLRGVLVIESFLWTFFEAFIPTLVSNMTPGPGYQDVLRVVFCVPLWNANLIHNFFIVLSMRTICNSFLVAPTGQNYAATVIRRIVRMVIILCIASGMATGIFTNIGTGYIKEFKTKLPNETIKAPVVAYDAVAALNSLFNLFWLSRDFYVQAANQFWPNATLWVPSVVYFQSYTVYFLMVILPYTRPKWHIQGLGLFAVGSFWMGYWGWYSATGLMLADIAINTTLRSELKAGLKVREDWRIPYWALALCSTAAGLALKYTFAALPQYEHSMVVLHPFLDLSENYSPKTYVASGPYARIDDWLVICGVMVGIELFPSAQYALSFKPLVWVGERSFSIFTAQCIVLWTGGMKLWLVLNERGLSTASANAVVFVTCLVAVVIFSELFYRCVDLPSRWIARHTYLWLVD